MEELDREYDKLLRGKAGNTGNLIVDFFTKEERQNTIGGKGIKYVEFRDKWEEKYSLIGYNKKLYDWYKNNRPKSEEYIIFRIFCVYWKCPMTMRPIIPLDLFKKFNPRKILDPCSGFGSRLLSANVFGAESYIGIDSNTNLEIPLRKMSEWLSHKSETKNTLIFKDCLTVDYSELDYDFVFTSPPYYNLEQYNHMKSRKTKTEWDNEFYVPLWNKLWESLREGYMCINVNQEIFIRTLIPTMGDPDMIIPLNALHKSRKYKEFIYIWEKPAL